MNIIRKPFTNDTFVVPGCKYLDESEHLARLFGASEDLLAALKDVDLRTTQAAIASGIGRKKNRTDFLLGELERIKVVARAGIAKAEGK